MKNQQGFTLIELMIVVAIIAILLAIAIPQYQEYVTKTRWRDSMSAIASVKTAIGECMQTNNGDGTLCDTATELGLSALPTPPRATGALQLTGAAPTGGANPAPGTVTATFTGNSSIGGYVYAAITTADASGNFTTWEKTGADTIPTKIINDTRR